MRERFTDITIIVSCLLICIDIYGQVSTDTLLSRFDQFMNSFPQEKVFVHLDRPYYAVGDDIWYKLYLVDAQTHLQATPSTMVTVELYNPSDSLVTRQYIKIDKGQDHGDIKIPLDWTPGAYILRAYTNYQLNYSQDYIFSQKVEIYGSYDKESLQKETRADLVSITFFAEGGDLVQGLDNNVAFEVVLQGQPIDAVGTLFNQQGDSLLSIKTLYNGLGFFRLKPKASEVYHVIIDHLGIAYKAPLPSVQKRGFVLNVVNRDLDHFTVELSASENTSLSGGFLIAHLRGEPVLVLDDMAGQHYLSKISKKQLRPGILHLTYFDASAMPRCERLIFVAPDRHQPEVRISMPYSHYGPKQKADLSIRVRDAMGTGALTNLSLSIIDREVINYAEGERNISSYLLLESDIHGVIRAPYDLMHGSVQEQFILDLILLTKGWRRFNWHAILDDTEPSINYSPNSGFGISGTITEKGKPDRPIKADVYLSVTGGTFEMQTVTTEEDGRFQFLEMEIPDSSSIIIQANRYKKKKRKKGSGPQGNRKVDIYIDTIDSLNFKKIEIRNEDTKAIDTRRLEDDIYIRNLSERAQNEGVMIELEEVIITQKKKTENEQLGIGQQLYSFPDNRVVIDSVVGALGNQTIFDIIRTRVAGAQVVGTPRVDQTVRFRGYRSLQLSTTAGFLVDGVEVDESFVNSLTLDQVKVIDVIKNLSRASVYGEFGAGGIVAIYLRDRNTIRKKKSINGIINMKHPGYYNARTFYVPNYNLHPNNQGLPDIRPTLYWNPSILTIDGYAEMQFYTSDKLSTYTAILQGITFDGRPVFEMFNFEVK